MTMHPGETRLNEFIDGELDARAEAEVSAHVAGCDTCRAELQRLRRVVSAAALLGASIEPRRDLWSGIDARIDAAGTEDLDAWRERSRRGLWGHRYHLAAAASLLMLLASTGTLLLMRDGERTRPVATAPAGTRDASPVRLVSVPGQADYVRAIQELDAVLRARQDRLDPQTVEVVRRNMAIIDSAIREAQHALANDPANGDLNQAVSAAYKTKINLLRRAVELPART